jgi:3-vinyl bacteriochlorophyllide hydratase
MPMNQASGLRSVQDKADDRLALGRSPHGLSNSYNDPLSRRLYTTNDVYSRASRARPPLYSPEERVRRDASPWTFVQGVLAPVQFAIFLISLALVLRYLATGEGYAAATVSVVVKTLALYAIMITGSIWEKRVFGRYLFAPAFYWEDVFSMLVLALHTAYLLALFAGWLTPAELMMLALAAYATYVINAAQFLIKLRMARLDRTFDTEETSELVGSVR